MECDGGGGGGGGGEKTKKIVVVVVVKGKTLESFRSEFTANL